MDDDGYGMTDDEEITIYGFIDQQGKAMHIAKFNAMLKEKNQGSTGGRSRAAI